MIIPESGKPADLDKTQIKTIAEADRVILWLSDVISDMDRQFEEAIDPDPLWLKRAKSARWWAAHIRHQVRELRESLAPTLSARDAVASLLPEFLSDEDLDELSEFLGEKFPHLTDIDLRAML